MNSRRRVNSTVMCSSHMNLEILTNATDDPQFVEILKHVISQLVGDEFPEQIFVMKIDNWFDHK